MSDEQDMRKMGGIWRMVPLTYTMMWVGSLALSGIPFFAGYYSKDIIIESAFAAGTWTGAYAFWLGIAAAVLTAFYSWRLIIMTFHGAPRSDEKTLAHVHESPKVMTAPLLLLGVGAILAGYVGHETLVGGRAGGFWGDSLFVLAGNTALEDAHYVPIWVKIAPIAMAVAGIGMAYLLYVLRPELPALLARKFHTLYLFLLNKWYFDELYDWLFVRPAHRLGRNLWKEGDGALIDGIGPDGIAQAVRDLARRASGLHTGYVYHYAFAMMIGVVGLISWYLFRQAG